MAEWKHWIIELRWRKNVYFGHTEVGMDVLVLWVGDDDGMTHRVLLRLVDPRVRGGHIHVLDFFILVHFVMQSDDVGPSSEESV